MSSELRRPWVWRRAVFSSRRRLSRSRCSRARSAWSWRVCLVSASFSTSAGLNRIGSVAGVIYSYNFYPSQQGDDEIRLYSNALIKLQGFHSAFGEDAQIYTHEEMLEQFELFKEGLKDDEDKRLIYLRLIREFKDNNPKEFKRIKQFPMKARTARKLKNINRENTNQGTVVFLKSPYKMEFYQVNKDTEVNSLTFLEAAQYFEANSTEPGYGLPEEHYAQVETAIHTFEQDFLGSTSEAVTTTDKADAISAQAKKFLRDMKSLTKRDDVKKACISLSDLVDKGTFTPMPNELRKLRQQLDKKQITYSQLDNMIIMIAKKYDAFENEQEEGFETYNEIDVNVAPDIVLSETFIS